LLNPFAGCCIDVCKKTESCACMISPTPVSISKKSHVLYRVLNALKQADPVVTGLHGFQLLSPQRPSLLFLQVGSPVNNLKYARHVSEFPLLPAFAHLCRQTAEELSLRILKNVPRSCCSRSTRE